MAYNKFKTAAIESLKEKAFVSDITISIEEDYFSGSTVIYTSCKPKNLYLARKISESTLYKMDGRDAYYIIEAEVNTMMKAIAIYDNNSKNSEYIKNQLLTNIEGVDNLGIF